MPPRFDVYASRRPSGDQVGSRFDDFAGVTMRSLFPDLRSRMNTSKTPFSSRPVNASCSLSVRGQKRGVWLYLPWKVTRFAPPPDDDITKICGEPCRLDTNAICVPSDENEGELSIAGLCVRREIT